jgi:hypothetical protein
MKRMVKYIEDAIVEIKKNWFPEHKATVKEADGLQIITFRKPQSVMYYMRIIIDGGNVLVTGDAGESLFQFTSCVNIKEISNMNIHYFHKKLCMSSGERYNFDKNVAVKYLRESHDDWEEDELEFDKSKFSDLIDEACSCNTVKSWRDIIVSDFIDFLEEVDSDWYEWIFDIGNIIPYRIIGYWVAFQLINKQLESEGE